MGKIFHLQPVACRCHFSVEIHLNLKRNVMNIYYSNNLMFFESIENWGYICFH